MACGARQSPSGPSTATATTTTAEAPTVADAGSPDAARLSAAGAAGMPPAPAHAQGVGEEDFYRMLLAAEDVGDKLQLLSGPNAARGLARHYRRGRPPEVRWVADAFWGDMHGNEPIFRVAQTAWLFDRTPTAKALVESLLADPEARTFSHDGVGPSVGDESHVLVGQTRITTGEQAHVEYVVRVGRFVSTLLVASGPRAPEGSLTVDLVAPLARRAAERARAVLAEKQAPPLVP
jgi:hypothetical protein